MDQHILHHARLATLMLHEQIQPDAVPDADKVAKALSKFAAFGRAIEDEQLSTSDISALLKSAFFGAIVKR